MDDEVTISCPNHHQNLVSRLWNYLLLCRGVDFDVQSCAGHSIRAHRLILDLFLSPEKLNQSAQHHQQDDGPIEDLLEFLYSGEVKIRRKQLGTLLKVARESEFEVLVDVLESRFQDYFATNTVPNAVVEHKACQNFLVPNDDHLDYPANGALPKTGNSSELQDRCDQECDWQAGTIKLESVEVTTTQIVDSDPIHQLDVHEEQTEGLLPYHGIQQINSPPNLIVPKAEEIGDGQDPETLQNADLPYSIGFQSNEQTSSTNEEFDGNISVISGELEVSLPEHQGEMGLEVSSVEHSKADVVSQDVPPATSSGSSSVGSPAPEENPQRIDFSVRKIKVEPGCNDDVSVPRQDTSKNGKDTKLLTCTVCGKKCQTKMRLVVHMRSHPTKKPFPCDVCKKTYAHQGYLRRHLLLHTEERPYKCQQCPKGFAAQTSLTLHERTHSGQRPFQCEEAGCSAIFDSRESLILHRKSEHLNLPPEYQCHLCERSFWLLSELNSHVRTHGNTQGGELLFSCPICHLSFNSSIFLKRHQRSHDTDMYRCDACPKVFIKKAHLDDHSRTHTEFAHAMHLQMQLRTHTDERPFRGDPDQSGMAFTRRSDMVYHMPSHGGFKTFKCTQNYCNEKYNTLSELTQHIRNHAQDRTFICAHCNMAYFTVMELIEHVRQKHPAVKNEERHECDICRETFDDLETLSLHADTHV